MSADGILGALFHSMQENTEQPPSLSQLLRESYLAEARAQQHHSRSDASSHRQFYRPLKSKAEDSVGHNDPQFPDLSAFLSQEELDKSVNLARQAIGHESREERAEVKASVPPSNPSNLHTSSLSSPEPLSLPSANTPAAPPAVPVSQPSSKFKEAPAARIKHTPGRKMTKSSTQQENLITNSKDPSDGFNDFNRLGRNTPYGPETQSKKEFLNKAADFIEELSSLFKANSSKRIRPRACKSHRNRNQNKMQGDEMLDPLSRDARERVAMPMEEEEKEEEREKACPAVSHQTQVQPDSGAGHVEFQDSRLTEEQQRSSVGQDVEKDAESCSLEESTHPDNPVSERPHFIQKLKSREVPEGSNVRLDCIVRGIPAPEVR